MLVYREQRRRERPATLFAALREQLDGLAPSMDGGHDRVVRLLIDVGVLETGLADAIHAGTDRMHPVTGALRAASVSAGHLLWHSWHGRAEAIAPWIARARAALGAAETAPLPDEIETRIPE